MNRQKIAQELVKLAKSLVGKDRKAAITPDWSTSPTSTDSVNLIAYIPLKEMEEHPETVAKAILKSIGDGQKRIDSAGLKEDNRLNRIVEIATRGIQVWFMDIYDPNNEDGPSKDQIKRLTR